MSDVTGDVRQLPPSWSSFILTWLHPQSLRRWGGGGYTASSGSWVFKVIGCVSVRALSPAPSNRQKASNVSTSREALNCRHKNKVPLRTTIIKKNSFFLLSLQKRALKTRPKRRLPRLHLSEMCVYLTKNHHNEAVFSLSHV